MSSSMGLGLSHILRKIKFMFETTNQMILHIVIHLTGKWRCYRLIYIYIYDTFELRILVTVIFVNIHEPILCNLI